jgi:vancomycin resistance protein YoaR
MKMGLFARLGLLGGLFGLTFAGGVWARGRYAPAGHLPGLKLDGTEVTADALASDGSLRDFVAKRAETLLARTVRLTVDGEDETALALGPRAGAGAGAGESTPAVVRLTLRDLGVTVDVDALTARVASLEDTGDLLERYKLGLQAKQGAIDIPMQLGMDAVKAFPLILRIKEGTDIAPVSARLDLEKKAAIPERLGRYVDPDGALAAILTAAARPDVDEVALPTRSFPPHVSRAYVEKLDVQTTLGEYETYFSRTGDQARRGKNIDVAAQRIDGLVLSPGELVSFNDVVGERSEDNGFAKSWEIFKGEMVEGVGGGTCQVASTFYATLFFGGMDVVERLPHSRPSAYIPMGLDATVVYPVVDLKVRNPYDFPVVVHAKTEGNKLKMQLLGANKVAKVSFQRELEDTFPYKRKVVFDPKLRWSKKVVIKQHGIQGYKIKRTRTLVYKDGTRKKETNTDLYPSTTEIYEVPPGFDIALLPPLPEADKDRDDDESKEGTSPPSVSANAQSVGKPKEAEISAATPVACTGDCVQSALDVIEGAGAHPPTEGQKNPPKTLMLTR